MITITPSGLSEWRWGRLALHPFFEVNRQDETEKVYPPLPAHRLHTALLNNDLPSAKTRTLLCGLV